MCTEADAERRRADRLERQGHAEHLHAVETVIGLQQRIAELEDILDDLVMEFGLGASGADWEQAINRARDLLKSSSRAK